VVAPSLLLRLLTLLRLLRLLKLLRLHRLLKRLRLLRLPNPLLLPSRRSSNRLLLLLMRTGRAGNGPSGCV
jgi:hypothetical protein